MRRSKLNFSKLQEQLDKLETLSGIYISNLCNNQSPGDSMNKILAAVCLSILMAVTPICIAQVGWNALWVISPSTADRYNASLSGPTEVVVGFMPIVSGDAIFEQWYDAQNSTSADFGQVVAGTNYNWTVPISQPCALVYSVNGNYSNPVMFTAAAAAAAPAAPAAPAASA